MIVVGVIVVGALGWGLLNRLAWQVALPWMMAQSDYEKSILLETRTVDLGQFEVVSGEIAICDPGYDRQLVKEGAIAFKVSNVLPGPWRAQVVRYTIDTPNQVRCAELLAFAASWPVPESPAWQEIHPDIGVDSGQAGFFDWRHFHTRAAVPADYSWKGPRIAPEDPWYSYCCDITLNNPNAGVIPTGVVSSSGWGDGGYPAYAVRDEQGRVVGLRLLFIFPDEVTPVDKPEIKPELEWPPPRD